MINVSLLRKELKDGTISVRDRLIIEDLFRRNDLIVQDIVVHYLKYSPEIDAELLIKYLERSRSIEAVAEVLTGLSNLGARDARFVRLLTDFARGVSWDFGDVIKLSAVFAIPRVMEPNLARGVLADAYKSDNQVVRDAVLVSAQTSLGVPPERILWGSEHGELASEISPEFLTWVVGKPT